MGMGKQVVPQRIPCFPGPVAEDQFEHDPDVPPVGPDGRGAAGEGVQGDECPAACPDRC